MRAAIYVRRSTEEHQIASLEVQTGEARRYIAAKGWTIADEHVYPDDAISRAEFKKRPGLISLLVAAERKAFDVVVCRDETRLGGDTYRTGIVIQDLLDAGAKLVYYFTDEEVSLDTAIDKFLVAARSFASELEREKIAGRTLEHLQTKARRGLNVGGRVYGYDNIEVKEGERRVRVEYRVNEDQASIVREIFTRHVAGDGLKKIAKDLNARGVLSPRGGGWCIGAIQPMLTRERYCGVLVWGKRAKTYRGGTKVRVARPANEWTRIEVPELRIISDDLWAAVQAKRSRRQSFGRTRGGGNTPRYMLSGIGRCGDCGGPMQAVNGRAAHVVIKVYACTYHRERGTCGNTLRRPVETVDAVVIEWMQRNVLQESVIASVMAEIRKRLSGSDGERAAEIELLGKERTKLRREIARLAEAIVSTDAAPGTLVRMMAEKERALSDADARIKVLRTAPAALDLEVRRIEKEARKKLDDLAGALNRHPEAARRFIESLLDGPITFAPQGKRYRLTGQCAIRLSGVPSGTLSNLIPLFDAVA